MFQTQVMLYRSNNYSMKFPGLLRASRKDPLANTRCKFPSIFSPLPIGRLSNFSAGQGPVWAKCHPTNI